MADAAVFERPATTHEVVLAELRRRIVAGEIRPGDPIRPDQLAAELRVSRVPIREALRILEGEGIVEHRPHHGAVLATLRAEDLREIYRLRQVLEARGRGRRARRASPRPTSARCARRTTRSPRRTSTTSPRSPTPTAGSTSRSWDRARCRTCSGSSPCSGTRPTTTAPPTTATDRAPREVAEDHDRILGAATARDLEALLARARRPPRPRRRRPGPRTGGPMTDTDLLQLDALLVRRRTADPRPRPGAGSATGSCPRSADWYEHGTFPARELAPELGRLGLLGMHLEGYGCAGASGTAYGLACMELEAGDSGLRSFVSVQGSLAMFAIHAFGSEEQKQTWLPRMAPARRSGASASPSPTADPTPARCARARRATAATGSSTARRCGSRTAASPTSRSSGRSPTTASAGSSCRPTRPGSAHRTSTRSSRCGRR